MLLPSTGNLTDPSRWRKWEQRGTAALAGNIRTHGAMYLAEPFFRGRGWGKGVSSGGLQRSVSLPSLTVYLCSWCNSCMYWYLSVCSVPTVTDEHIHLHTVPDVHHDACTVPDVHSDMCAVLLVQCYVHSAACTVLRTQCCLYSATYAVLLVQCTVLAGPVLIYVGSAKDPCMHSTTCMQQQVTDNVVRTCFSCCSRSHVAHI